MIPIKIFKRNLRDVLHEIASPEYQERVWVRGLGPETSSFVEAVCTFFEVSLVDERPVIYWREVGFTDDDINALERFADEFRAFLKTAPEIPRDIDILANPIWHGLTNGAARLLQKLDRVIK